MRDHIHITFITVVVKSLSCIWLFCNSMDYSPLSMGFPRQEYWSGLPFPPRRDLPDPGIKPTSPALSGRYFTNEPPEKPLIQYEKGQREWGINKSLTNSWSLVTGMMHKWAKLHWCIFSYVYHILQQRAEYFTNGKEYTCQCRRYKRHGLNPWVGKIPWRRKWVPTPVSLPREFHG